MQVIPAIDLRGGRCVRLQQGDFHRETVFGDDPAAMALRWQGLGARRLHLVDLDGAKTGKSSNADAVRAILASVRIPCQLGGGVRDDATADFWLGAGVDRVIVGTQALRDPAWFRALALRRPNAVALGIDARDGKVAASGWLEVTSSDPVELGLRFNDLPLACVIYTDIARDGMLGGPDFATTAELAARLAAPVIASGGVGSLEDLTRLRDLPVAGCIVGRALYDGRFDLAAAIERASAPANGPSAS